MRYYTIIKETMNPEREIEILHSTGNGEEAIKKLAAYSDEYEEDIIDGKCRVLMSTYSK